MSSIAPNRVIVQVSFPQSGNASFKTVAFPFSLNVEEARNIAATKGGISADEKSKYGLYLPEEDAWMREDGKIETYKLKDRVKVECKLKPVDMLVSLEEDSKMLPIDYSKPVSALLVFLCEKFGEKSSDTSLILEGADSKTTTLDSSKTLFDYRPPTNAKLIIKKKTKIGGIFRRSESLTKTKLQKLMTEVENPASKIFGAPLESVCDESYGGIPAIVAKTIEYIEKEGIKLEGIFRISGNQNEIQNMKKSFDSGNDVNIRSCSSPHIASGLLKLYFRELPEPLFTFGLYETFLGIMTSVKNIEARVKYFKIIIDTLPVPNYTLLMRLLPFLAEVIKNEDINKMAIHNVATVFGPNLLKSSDDSAFVIIQDTAVINGVFCDIVKNYEFMMGTYSHNYISYGKTLYAYTKNSDVELSFAAGDYVFVEKEEEGWLEGDVNGNRGFVPANYVQILAKFQSKPPQKAPPKPAPAAKSNSNNSSNNNNNNNNNNSNASSGASGSAAKGGMGMGGMASVIAAAAVQKVAARAEEGGLSKKLFLQELDELKRLVQRQVENRMKLEAVVSKLTSQLESINGSMNENHSTNANSFNGSEQLNESFQSLKTEYQRLKQEAADLTFASREIQSNIGEISNALTKANREISELKEEKVTLQGELSNLTEKIDALSENNIAVLKKIEDEKNSGVVTPLATSSGGTSRREPPSRRVIPLRKA